MNEFWAKIISIAVKAIIGTLIVLAILYGVNWGIARSCGEGPYDVLFSCSSCKKQSQDNNSETSEDETDSENKPLKTTNKSSD